MLLVPYVEGVERERALTWMDYLQAYIAKFERCDYMSSKTIERIDEMGMIAFLLFFFSTIVSAGMLSITISCIVYNCIASCLAGVLAIIDSFHIWLTEYGVVTFYGFTLLDISLAFQAKYKIYLFEELSDNSN